MTKVLVGRHLEQTQLMRLYNSDEAEFIALYGRRRVGKTFLIRQLFDRPDYIYFEMTGQKDAPLRTQLENFAKALAKTFYPQLLIKTPTSWGQAFEMLTIAINQIENNEKVVIFLDELPWLSTKKSLLMSALDFTWNSIWVKNPRIKLIVCGSAASWMIKNIINNKGGLHNRITSTLLLKPFELHEIKQFLDHSQIALTHHQILQISMVTGGIPYYLRSLIPGESAVQNINQLCFNEMGLLYREFDNLFDSLFDGSEIYKEIISIIASKRYGINKSEILKQTKLSTSGGRFNTRLHELEEAGFIKKFIQTERRKSLEYFRLVDEYCYFYLTWILPTKKNSLFNQIQHYWELQSQTAAWKSWSGYTFETFCFKEINQIIKKLGISHLVTEAYPWRFIPKEDDTASGAQIDLIFKRNDDCITLCEIKYNQSPLTITKEMAEGLHRKINVFRKQTGAREQIFIALITNAGIHENQYSREMLSHVIQLDDFFT